MRALSNCAGQVLAIVAILLAHLLLPASAAFVNFENCLPQSLKNSNDPKLLQFTPLFVDASFVRHASSHPLDITIYGNVSGQQFTGRLPPPGSSEWSNNNTDNNGKITDTASSGKTGKLLQSTLVGTYTVLTYNVGNKSLEAFCPQLINGTCPLGPAFDADANDPHTLPAFSHSRDFDGSYAFSTISTTFHIISSEEKAPIIGCISAQITPDQGSSVKAVLTWVPAGILILKAVATLSAAIWSPWGSLDVFRWSSNYGRDEDLLRLVTPGFGDCLQYIQFVVLTGSLTLQYPGFFQPAVSHAAWSTLLFNESFVSGGSGTVSLIDGLYNTNATYGLTRMGQLVGVSEVQDIWACMAIFLLVIAGAIVVLCQAGFIGRWIFRLATKTSEEDLRSKNLPFTLGNIIRLLFNYFILPIVALSLFQLVISRRSLTSVIACAALLLVIMIAWAAWILRVIFSTKPRTLLFDDVPLVLNYGTLYNTYSDSAAPFALVPVFITFMRGVAIGAVQPSGIAQIIILAICEVILILTLNGFRPFQGQTSMNLYHTFFASVRLTTILLMIAFVPSLGVTEAPKGWIGYVILLLHACVLVLGFFLNSAQTIVEVLARSLGAGHDAQNGAIRGSVLNWRMLKKRRDRSDPADRGSMMSSAAMLAAERNAAAGSRSRSVSASSQQLLNTNRLSGFENFSSANDPLTSPDPELFGALGTMSSSNTKPVLGGKPENNYYRPPRPRKATLDATTNPGMKTRSTADFPYRDSPGQASHHARDSSYDSSGMPAPAYLRNRQGSGDETGPRTDYAVREVDQYYRGPALNDQPSRKLKTGPADPTGPASTAQSWFQKLVFGVKGKKKDQSKGFEVVRSSRMPPGMQPPPDGAGEEEVELEQTPTMNQEPYRDMPDSPRQGEQAGPGSERLSNRSVSPIEDVARPAAADVFHFGFDAAADAPAPSLRPDSDTIRTLNHPVLEPISAGHRTSMGVDAVPSPVSEVSTADQIPGRGSPHYGGDEGTHGRYSDLPVPALDPIDTVGSINLPSRFNSNAGSYVPTRFNSTATQRDMPGVSASTAGYPALVHDSAPSRMHSNRSQGTTGDIRNSQDGQAWLRAVDNLQWEHEARARNHQDPVIGPMHPSPSVPRRNSRRTLSQEQAAIRYQSQQQQNVFVGFDSNTDSADFLTSPVDQTALDRTHRVVHHRAADSITRNSLGANAAMQGSSAEFFGQTPPTRDEDDFLK